MPSNVVKSFAKRSGKSVAKIEDYWDEAEIVVKKQYPDVPPESDRYYALITAIVKRMAGIEDKKVETTHEPSKAVTPSGSILEAVTRVTKSPFSEKAGVTFINKDDFLTTIESVTGHQVDEIKRSDPQTYLILLDERERGRSGDISSIQHIYGKCDRGSPIYSTSEIRRGLYQLTFNNKVVIK